MCQGKQEFRFKMFLKHVPRKKVPKHFLICTYIHFTKVSENFLAMNVTYVYGNTGVTNTQVGSNTLGSLTTGLRNTAFGDNALSFLTTGNDNSAFGSNVASVVSSNPSFTSSFGSESLKNITSAMNVDAFGYQALTNVTTGNNNAAFGSTAGSIITTGTENAFMGSGATAITNNTSQSVAMGYNSSSANNSIAMGKGTQVLSIAADPNTLLVGMDIVSHASSDQAVIVGSRSGSSSIIINSVLLGHDIATTSASIEDSVIAGNNAMQNTQDSFQDVVLGNEAAQDVDFSEKNVIIGVRANQTSVPTTTFLTPLKEVVAIGYEAAISNSALGNTFIGSKCATNTTAETCLVCCGYEALKYVEGGNRNTAIGYQAMLGVNGVSIGAAENVAYGTYALQNITSGSCNVVAGSFAGATLTSENNNVIFGYQADITAGVQGAVVVGTDAVAAASDSVVAGHLARSEVVGGIALGRFARLLIANGDTPGSCLFGDSVNLPSTGILKFKGMRICDASWVGEDESDAAINNEGHIVRGTSSQVTGSSTGIMPLTLQTVAVLTSTAIHLETTLLGRRTDGGGLNNVFAVRVDGVVRNDGVTIDVYKNEYIQVKDELIWTVNYVAVGSTVEIQVTGSVGSSVDWTATVRQYSV